MCHILGETWRSDLTTDILPFLFDNEPSLWTPRPTGSPTPSGLTNIGWVWDDPCDVWEWEFSSIATDDAKETGFKSNSICLHGIWGMDNDWISRRFYTDNKHKALEIKARVWIICEAEYDSKAAIFVDGVEYWRKRRIDRYNCDGLRFYAPPPLFLLRQKTTK